MPGLRPMSLILPELRIDLPPEAVAAMCRKHGVSELAVFGSALRDDFDPDRSDVDFLVRFIDNDAGPWMGKFLDLRNELGAVVRRKVDVVDWNGVEQSTNRYRRDHILKHRRTIYVA